MRQYFPSAPHIMLLLSFCALVFIPPFFYVSLWLSSMTIGLVAALAAIIVFYYRAPPIINWHHINAVGLALIALLTLHSLYFLVVEEGYRKAFGIILCFAMLASAAIFSNIIYRCNSRVLLRIFKLLVIVALLIGFGSFFIDANFLHYEKYHKSMFPFAEPSHYALIFSSFFFVTGVVVRKTQRFLLVAAVLLLGALKPNMTLLVIGSIMVVVYYILPLKKQRIIIFTVALLLGLSVLSSVDSSKLAYFYERLPFVEGSERSAIPGSPNITALVYMQGWEVLTDTLVSTGGLGVGLLNMENTIPGYYAELIYEKTGGTYRNRAEGSFFASKLVTEYGVVGVLVLVAYCTMFLKSLGFFYRLERYIDNKKRSKEARYPLSLVYAHSIIVIFVVEAFVRGVGYFSIGVFLMMVAAFTTRRFELISLQSRRNHSSP